MSRSGESGIQTNPSRLERDAERALTRGCGDTRMRLSTAAQALEKLRAKQDGFPDQHTALLREPSLIETRLPYLEELVATGQ